jgi:hypothetical protein
MAPASRAVPSFLGAMILLYLFVCFSMYMNQIVRCIFFCLSFFPLCLFLFVLIILWWCS